MKENNKKVICKTLHQAGKDAMNKHDPITRWEQRSITLAVPELGPHLKKKIQWYGSLVKDVVLTRSKITYQVNVKHKNSIANEIGAFVNGYICRYNETIR